MSHVLALGLVLADAAEQGRKIIIAMLVTGAINWRYQRDFARVWAESLRVKHRAPLGEDALARQMRKRR